MASLWNHLLKLYKVSYCKFTPTLIQFSISNIRLNWLIKYLTFCLINMMGGGVFLLPNFFFSKQILLLKFTYKKLNLKWLSQLGDLHRLRTHVPTPIPRVISGFDRNWTDYYYLIVSGGMPAWRPTPIQKKGNRVCVMFIYSKNLVLV